MRLGGCPLLLQRGSPLRLQRLLEGGARLVGVELLLLGLVELLLKLHDLGLQAGALLLQKVVLVLNLLPLLLLLLGLLRHELVLLLHGLPLEPPFLELGLLLGKLALPLLNLRHGAVELCLGLGDGSLPLVIPHAGALRLHLLLGPLELLLEGLELAHALVEEVSLGVRVASALAGALDLLEELLGLLKRLLPGGLGLGLEVDLGDHLRDLLLELHARLLEGVLLGEHLLQALAQDLDHDNGLVPLPLRVRPARPDLGLESGVAVLEEGLLVKAGHGGAQARGEAHVEVPQGANAGAGVHRRQVSVGRRRDQGGEAADALPPHVPEDGLPAHDVDPSLEVDEARAVAGGSSVHLLGSGWRGELGQVVLGVRLLDPRELAALADLLLRGQELLERGVQVPLRQGLPSGASLNAREPVVERLLSALALRGLERLGSLPLRQHVLLAERRGRDGRLGVGRVAQEAHVLLVLLRLSHAPRPHRRVVSVSLPVEAGGLVARCFLSRRFRRGPCAPSSLLFLIDSALLDSRCVLFSPPFSRESASRENAPGAAIAHATGDPLIIVCEQDGKSTLQRSIFFSRLEGAKSVCHWDFEIGEFKSRAKIPGGGEL